MTSTDLRQDLEHELATVVPPPGDLDRAVREGRRIRRRRRTVRAVAATVAVAVFAGVTSQLTHGSTARDPRPVAPLGRLDFSEGLRAYAAPGGEIHLGGQQFPASRLQYLDTDATATPYGVLFYDAGVPRLLDESGKVADLEPGAETTSAHFTSKVDSQAPLVAYAAVRDGQPVVTVRNLATDDVVARRDISRDTVIDGLDGGVVFLRTPDGTTTWDSRSGDVQQLAGARTRVADVRNGVVLYSGPRPDGAAAASYRLVDGAIDAQLTYDGKYVLYWSSTLEPTGGGRPVVLDEGGTSGWWAVDTDGSILTAVPGKGSTSTVYDCEVPSGHCTELGPLSTLHGDPMFIGVDM